MTDLVRVLKTWQLTYLDGRVELVQAHSLSWSGGHPFSFTDTPIKRRVHFYREPDGVILSVIEDDLREMRKLDLEPIP